MTVERSAIILCGGASVRMGQSKALLLFDGEALLSRVCRAVSGSVDRIVVVCSQNQELPKLPEGCVCVTDDLPDAGPLAGLKTGLDVLGDSGGYTFVCGCDHPFLTTAFISDLLSSSGGTEAVVVRTDRPQPLCAWYRNVALHQVAGMLASGERRLSRLLDRLDVREVFVDELADRRAMLSVNTPEEYEAAVRLARTSGQKT